MTLRWWYFFLSWPSVWNKTNKWPITHFFPWMFAAILKSILYKGKIKSHWTLFFNLQFCLYPCKLFFLLFSLFSFHYPHIHINAFKSRWWGTCLCYFFSTGQCIFFLTERRLLAIAVRDEGVPACGLLVIKKPGFINKSCTNRTKDIMFLFRCRLVFVVTEGVLLGWLVV